MKSILFSVLLGFAGLGPQGAVIAMSAIAGGVSKAKVHQLALMVFDQS